MADGPRRWLAVWSRLGLVGRVRRTVRTRRKMVFELRFGEDIGGVTVGPKIDITDVTLENV